MKMLIRPLLIALSIGPVFASSMLPVSGKMMQLKPAQKEHPTCRGMIVECKGDNGNVAMVQIHVVSHYQNNKLNCLPENKDLTTFVNGDAQKLCTTYQARSPCHSKTCQYIGWGYT